MIIIPRPSLQGDTLATTGSISGNILTVKDSDGFRAGDPIIIPADQKLGNDGPGGGWPPRRFANEQAMRAANIPDKGYAACMDTKEVWNKTGGVFYRMLTDLGGSYYDAWINPKAYFGVIVKIDGNRWTLDRPAVVPVAMADVFYDGGPRLSKAIQDARNGANANARTKVNANALFPGWKRVAVGDVLVPFLKTFIELSCDYPGSFEIFSPKGCPSISLSWRKCNGCLSRWITLRGNFGDHGFGFGWAGSMRTGAPAGLLGDTFRGVGQFYLSGHEFVQGCVDCEHTDALVINVPSRASGGENSGNCWSRRIENRQTVVTRRYVQWQFQYASTTSKCGIEDCMIDSDALIPGFEIMHGQGDIIRPRGRNALASMNNASGSIVNPDLRFDAGCIKPLEGYPAHFQYATGNGFGVPAINLNGNAGTWALANGIRLTNVVVDQSAGYLDSKGNNLVAVSVQDKITSFDLEGLDATFPAKRSPTSAGGAVGLQSYAQKTRIGGKVRVVGECVNSGNNFNLFVNPKNADAVKSPSLTLDVPKGGTNFNWQIS